MAIRGIRGLRLHQLVQVLEKYISDHGVPGTLIVCVGTNDLGLTDKKANKLMLCQSMDFIKKQYPSIFVVWSDILQCRKYKHFRDQLAGADARVSLNISGRMAAHRYICHRNIRHRLPFYRDNVHLNPEGCIAFLDNILRFLQGFVAHC